MNELGIGMSGQTSKGLGAVPLQYIDLVISFGDAHRQISALPPRATVETWPVTTNVAAPGSNAADLIEHRAQRDEIDNRVFALFLDSWRKVA